MVKFSGCAVRELIDCSDNSILAFDVTLSDGSIGRASAAYDGHKTGKPGEALALARERTRRMAAGLAAIDVFDQTAVDRVIVEAGDRSGRINAGLGFSLAVAKAAAASRRLPFARYIGNITDLRLPRPLFSLIRGGDPVGNQLDFSEFMLVPAAASFLEQLRMCRLIYRTLRQQLAACGRAVCDATGAFIPRLLAGEEALALLRSAMEQAGYQPGRQAGLAINAAAADYFVNGEYNFWREGRVHTPAELIAYYCRLADDYSVVAIENAVAAADGLGWRHLRRLEDGVQLLGQELPAAAMGIFACQTKPAYGVVLSPAEADSVTGLLAAARRIRSAGCGWVANLSGPVDAESLAGCAVGGQADAIKLGPPLGHQADVCNQLLRLQAVGSP
ncbi:MAG: hypothetical protein E6X17_17105, partial [Sporomusaceae bacterium]|nr:hypothetical protein [Sporomusaceae bacterium]